MADPKEDSLHADAAPVPDMGVAIPSVDYRSNPSHGQADVAYRPPSYADPNPPDVHHFEPPQPDLGHGLDPASRRGYSLNPMDAPPNRLVPGNPSETLPYGHTPFSPDEGVWDYGLGQD